jgi:hypothetical protein
MKLTMLFLISNSTHYNCVVVGTTVLQLYPTLDSEHPGNISKLDGFVCLFEKWMKKIHQYYMSIQYISHSINEVTQLEVGDYQQIASNVQTHVESLKWQGYEHEFALWME